MSSPHEGYIDGLVVHKTFVGELAASAVGEDVFTAVDAAAARDVLGVVGRGDLVRNVKDYGAVGDGVADDTAEIHLARDAAGVGGKVFFPSGTYLVDGLTASMANQTWELASGATVKMKTGAAEILHVTAANVTVTGGTFDGSNGTVNDWSQMGIKVTGDGVTIRNATVQNSPSHGVYAINCSRVTVTNCTITEPHEYGIMVQRSDAGSVVDDILITDNIVVSAWSDAHGIYVRGDSQSLLVNRATISRNTVRLTGTPVGETGGIIFFNGVDWMISDNIVRGATLGITTPAPKRAVISGNLVTGFTDIGIEVPGNVDQCVIRGNIVDPSGTIAPSGIQFSTGTINELTVSGNTIKNFTATGSRHIDFNSGSIINRVALTGNTIRSNCASFRAVWVNGAASNLAVVGNVIDGNGTASSGGIIFNSAITGLTVTGNLFANLSQGAVVLATGSAVTQDYIVVSGNTYNSSAVIYNGNYGSGAAALGKNVSTELLPMINSIKDTNGNTAISLTATASAVSYLNVTSAATGSYAGGGGISLKPASTDTDVNLFLQPRGSGYVSLNGADGAKIIRARANVSGVNYWDIFNSATGNALQANAVGTDANISINVVPKGAGVLQANGNPVGVKVAVPASASATGKPGQWASDASYIYTYTGDGTTHTWVRASAAAW